MRDEIHQALAEDGDTLQTFLVEAITARLHVRRVLAQERAALTEALAARATELELELVRQRPPRPLPPRTRTPRHT